MSLRNAAKHSFKHAMQTIENQYKNETLLIEQVATLDYLADIIKIDIQGSSYAKVLYKERGYEYNNLLPTSAKDKNGKEVNSFTGETQKMRISKESTCLVSMIWKSDSLFSSICNLLKHGYVHHEFNQLTNFYPFWNMHITINGGHHITCGYMKSAAIAKSSTHDITTLFDHVYSDGAAWYNSHTKEKLLDVEDFRFAVLFEVAKLRNNLCNQCVAPIGVPTYLELSNEKIEIDNPTFLDYLNRENQELKEETKLLLSENKRLRRELSELKQ